MLRVSEKERKTKETDIQLKINIDGEGQSNIKTGLPFFDHMLELFAKHGFFDLDIAATGDLEVDGHHTVEDVGIVLGQAFKEALGDNKGIQRYGTFTLPMDDAIAAVSVDISGRSTLVFNAELKQGKVGDFMKESDTKTIICL